MNIASDPVKPARAGSQFNGKSFTLC